MSRAALVERLELQRLGCLHLEPPSPFYAALLGAMAHDAEQGGPVWDLLGPHAEAPFEAVYPLRLLGGLHRVVLAGDAPDLAVHYPSTGGDGDADAAWPAVRRRLQEPPPEVLDALTRPPQTNEVGRSAALAGGLAVVRRETGRPLRLLELGSSAGLNLRLDGYRYDAGDGDACGPHDGRVRFTDVWAPHHPPFRVGLDVATRRGVDRDPIDATTDDGRLRLLSYVWPDQHERFARLEAALATAHGWPVEIDVGEIPTWVAAQLADPAPDVATVAFHSVVWQYLDDHERAATVAAIERAGDAATADAPLAWLRLEPQDGLSTRAELRLRTWPGGADRVLATSGFHGGPVRWTA